LFFIHFDFMLKNDNYTLWLIPMEAKLYKIKALTIVTSAIACPDPETDKDNTRLYVKLNKDTYVEIVQHLSPKVLAYDSSSLPANERFNGLKLWKLLKAKFAGNDITSRTTCPQKKIVLSRLTLDNQVKTILMLDKLPQEFHSFKTNIALNFKTSPFNQVLEKLEDFAAQNQLNNYKKTIKPIQTFYSRLTEPEINCPHCKQGFQACSHCFKSGNTEENSYQKHPDNQHTKTPAPSLKGHSSHLTRYTPEDAETLEYLQQKYPAPSLDSH
ncbi:hypothetical protein VP01_1666g1, partial [Puccinia sorghi]